VLNPLIGKSLVVYATRQARTAGAASRAETPAQPAGPRRPMQ